MRTFVGAAIAAITVGTLALAPVAARADTAKDYNLFVLGDMNVKGSDTEGRVAVGGNATLDSYSVGKKADPNAVNLVVGGNLKAGITGGGSTDGKTIVGGTATFHGWSSAGLQASGTPLPVDFAAESLRLNALTKTLSQYSTTGAVGTVPWGGQFTLNGLTTGVAGLNVFDISGAALGTSNNFTIDLLPGQQVLINVDGLADHMSGGLTINEAVIDPNTGKPKLDKNGNIVYKAGSTSDVLWNFYDATTLSFSGISMLGSVLAPDADYLGGSGQLNGELIVKSFSDSLGATQINTGGNFSGDLLDAPPPPAIHLPGAVPEPATWAMMILGFGLVGATLRRRRAATRFA